MGAALLIGLLAACGSDSDSSTTPSGGGVTELQIQDLRVGTGAQATAGRVIVVNYTGWLYDQNRPDRKGAMFDTSIGRAPFPFTLGAGQVIAGWDQGLPGMRVGGARSLTIPPQLAYGAAGRSPSIPPNASLIFDVELLEVR